MIIVRPKHECLSCLGLFVFKNKFGGIYMKLEKLVGKGLRRDQVTV